MSNTDYLRLSEHKIFKEACDRLPKDVNKPQNLIALQESVLFTWDFSNNCVLSLNIKAARSKEGDNIIHQKLVPDHQPLFTPELLIVNDSGSFLAVAGPNGVLVIQLPIRCPPYGAFKNNEELVACRSFALDERLLCFSETIEVRQVKFHPGSVSDCHVLVLTSDNTLRLYQIEKNEALNIGEYQIGKKPSGMFPGTKTPFLDIYGENAVDFDFAFPEIFEKKPLWEDLQDLKIFNKEKERTMTKLKNMQSKASDKIIPIKSEQPKTNKNEKKTEELLWPVFILRGDYSVYSIDIDLNNRFDPSLKGPYPMSKLDLTDDAACSIICLKTTPQIVCIASATGTLINSILLNSDLEKKRKYQRDYNRFVEVPDKELFVFETVELELGLSILHEAEEDSKYKCPIFLHKDESKSSRYFASHGAGVHTVNINCVEALHEYVTGSEDQSPSSDIFNNPSAAEYLVCTKTSASRKSNPVIGFAVYYEPTSIISLLSDGSVVTMALLSAPIVPKSEMSFLEKDGEGEVKSPLKKMLNEPFDQYIQKILKKGSSRPLLKLSSTSSNTPEECYDLLQRAAQMFREEHFKNFTKAREELEKRGHTLTLLKQAQKKELSNMNNSKELLRDKAEYLAEKYEDIKDKQDALLKRCEQLIMLVSRKKPETSDAENKFMEDMEEYSLKCTSYQNAIDKLKNKNKYQQVKIENWKSNSVKKVPVLGEMQASIIKTSLQESTQKINNLMKQVNEYKTKFNLK
ncbi:unnamed protein product [Ceutorhynchus assimilis]|uniref:Nuclear pore complex protein Nup88 n=1 Tax=Ceutorhynchus assimilis TaxID=467358 RepID=A0A9P0DDP6_9CUCU|nr:unnamed protein product [Ceutorhynchus assimilis]